MKRYLLILALVAIGFGCNSGAAPGPAQPASLANTGWPDGPSYVTTGTTNQHTVAMSNSDAQDAVVRARILDAVEQTVNAFETQEGVVVPSTTVGVTDDAYFPLGMENVKAHGRWLVDLGRPDSVLVTVGIGQTLPALYHELAHRTFFLYDHTDPRWPLWDQRGGAIAAQLAARP